MIPSEEELDRALCLRHGPEVHATIKSATVGIAGLGGLGSNIAAMLTRTGVSHLIIADFDSVDISNINRQNYSLRQLGSAKVSATDENLKAINPYMTIEKHHVKLTPSNIPDVFGRCGIVCEAFDVASEKAMLINTLLEKCPKTKIVSGSGLAGYGRSNDIRTKKLLADLYMCGDDIDMKGVKGGLMSPRVNVCAGHAANMVISLLMKEDL
ncbi:MAG: sulfur carrier protein ThiS adenylyltransferase ThiF [Candidatus Methanoplasma sp.]|jgi:sulfur carrier protein ThiS adenylyltransferase|nr:sulfur carrier protein ThiS adenylyltransferase ThiF [Candidatus Methanoplasma sp.]